ncbi:uncharacterized protein LOC122932717 isoform X2 [Bufo gargarizans]|uniref:uncharacterized protein LOC122932717 isoform X2 n=1 Tax=Bufo gargarizans TaxID=30331 RepID=UPI001CF33C47|nr:uncharacterized protein LOC122932717 isoform X2 [Bufo gargarizans]
MCLSRRKQGLHRRLTEEQDLLLVVEERREGTVRIVAGNTDVRGVIAGDGIVLADALLLHHPAVHIPHLSVPRAVVLLDLEPNNVGALELVMPKGQTAEATPACGPGGEQSTTTASLATPEAPLGASGTPSVDSLRPQALIVGLSYIFSAQRRTEGQPCGGNLGVDNVAVHWWGVRGLRIVTAGGR